LLAVAGLAACTPAEVEQWQAWRAVDPVAADAHARVVLDRAVYGRCGEWHDTAISVGWSEEQWPTVNRIMWRESKCRPDAYNRAGAHGLMQVMGMWADDCGFTREMLFDPMLNLACARYILDAQGWGAWSTY
jgi:hypothetical protein